MEAQAKHIPKFKAGEWIKNVEGTTQFVVDIHPCDNYSEGGYTIASRVDFDSAGWLDFKEENEWIKIGEVRPLTNCPHCGEIEAELLLYPTIIPVAGEWIFKNKDDVRNPKYTFMIKASCKSCGKYIKFIPQTEEAISFLKSTLETLYKHIDKNLTIDNK